jgi:hypothetical protein
LRFPSKSEFSEVRINTAKTKENPFFAPKSSFQKRKTEGKCRKMHFSEKKIAKTFGGFKKMLFLCNRKPIRNAPHGKVLHG